MFELVDIVRDTLECENNNSNDLQDVQRFFILAVAIMCCLIFCFAVVVFFLGIIALRSRKEVKVAKQMLKENTPIDLEFSANSEGGKFTLTGISSLERWRSDRTFKTKFSQSSIVTKRDKSDFKKFRSILGENASAYTILNGPARAPVMTESQVETFLEKVIKELRKEIIVAAQVKADESIFCEFNLDILPNISLDLYVMRLMKGLESWYKETEDEFEISVRCILMAVLYLEQLKTTQKAFTFTEYNQHKLLAALSFTAAKFSEDEVISNTYWAEVSGLDVKEVNKLEQIFCFRIDFDFVIDKKDYMAVGEKFGVFTKQNPANHFASKETY